MQQPLALRNWKSTRRKRRLIKAGVAGGVLGAGYLGRKQMAKGATKLWRSKSVTAWKARPGVSKALGSLSGRIRGHARRAGYELAGLGKKPGLFGRLGARTVGKAMRFAKWLR